MASTAGPDMGGLPPDLVQHALARLGLPFLLFDSGELLVFANEAARKVVPVLSRHGSSRTAGSAARRSSVFSPPPPSSAMGAVAAPAAPASSSGFFAATSAVAKSQARSTHASGEPSSASRTNIGSGDTTMQTALSQGLSTASRPTISPLPATGNDSIMRSVSGTPRTIDTPPPIPSPAAPPATLLQQEYGQHSSEIFRESATDKLGFHLARLNRSGTNFTLARILSDRKGNGVAYANAHVPAAGAGAHAPDSGSGTGRSGHNGYDDPEDWDDSASPATEVQSCLTLVDDLVASRWWHASISSFASSNERSYYFAVLLVSPQTAPERPPVILPENISPTEPLTRPMLSRKKSEPVKAPATIEECVDESTLDGRRVPVEFYKIAIESMPQILFTSAKDGVVTYLNTQWYDFTGWNPELPNSELWADVFHPADVQQAVEMYGDSIRTGQDIHLNYRVKNKNGQYRWMIARGRPTKDPSGSVTGFVSTLTDGQDLINARQEAVQARHYVSTVLRAAAIALIVVDPARRITLFDGHVSSTLGMGDRDATAGKLLDSTVWGDPLLIVQVREMLDQHARTNGLPTERDFQSTVGACNFRYRLTPLRELTERDHDLANMQSGAGSDTATTLGTGGVVGTGDFSGIAIVCTDVTAMKQAEVALQQSQIEREALLASETAAKEASRMKSVFVSSLSHEIRTPISGMLGISELLLADASLGERQRSLVSKQLQAGELLLQLVSMVLDIGKMEANKLEIERTPFLLVDLLRDMDIFGSMAEAKLLYFNREATSAYAGPLLGDRLRLAQVLSNFVSNAVKFTTTGGVTLSVGHEDHGEAIMLDCKIVDTGIGIDGETLPQLFQPFHQASVSTARHYGGSGLGLTIAKQLIELMGGTVSLQSALGVGSSVHVRIPLAKVPLADPRLSVPDQVASSEKAQIARDRCSILIAEDNALLQEVYAALLRKMGFTRVTVADDGQHAVDQVDKADFDVILMDVEMPRMNGPAAVAAIRQHPRSSARGTKVIALTANSMSGDKERFLALNFDMYLPKPVRASALEAAITECLVWKGTRAL